MSVTIYRLVLMVMWRITDLYINT